MTLRLKLILASVLAVSGMLISGCSTRAPNQSSIPWSQPAAWEGQIPGMAQQTGR
jgi:hypothetical protein